MKSTSFVYRFGISVLLVFALATNAQAVSDVANTVHNLSTSSIPFNFYASDNETQICIFCHTPHGGSLTGPLWNRNDLAGSFTMYTSSTTSATVNTAAATNAVNSESMLCLACHDGSVSVYEMINYSSVGQPTSFSVGGSNVPVQNLFAGYQPNLGGGSLGSFGGQLGDDHPISFSYTGVLDDYIADLKAGELHDVGSLPPEIRLFGALNRVECSTCHNPHEATLPSFLVMSNAVSALCLGCHNK